MPLEQIEQPGSPQELAERGYIIKGRLPNRQVVMLVPLLFGHVQLGIGPEHPLEDVGVFADTWEFADISQALVAFFSFDPDQEPTGWYRHPRSQRYRINGDPQLEYIKLEQESEAELARAVRVAYQQDMTVSSIRVRKPIPFVPKQTRCWQVSSSHSIGDDGHQCFHEDLVLVYLDRAVVLGITDLAKLASGRLSMETITTRLTAKLETPTGTSGSVEHPE